MIMFIFEKCEQKMRDRNVVTEKESVQYVASYICGHEHIPEDEMSRRKRFTIYLS
jgi:hypothetical protein